MASDFPPSSIRPVLKEVTQLLSSRSETISIAETAAGGIISASLLSVPGASKYYKGGLTLYTLESRVHFAGWTEDSMKNYKGPNKDVVIGLAKNVREKLRSTYCLCESGTAGPGASGASRERTPDFVALAVASEEGIVTQEHTTGMDGDREKNMVEFARLGLELLKNAILQSGKGPAEGNM
ncbi:MAG: hypothetical protein LQ343_004662 [Gyalolechia ehrenbergii]|nr:MAG: hypothetical protein LQ343_004662 [Gyalolechia ehrenbergii]